MLKEARMKGYILLNFIYDTLEKTNYSNWNQINGCQEMGVVGAVSREAWGKLGGWRTWPQSWFLDPKTPFIGSAAPPESL